MANPYSSAAKTSIHKHFGEIEDPRMERRRAHHLIDIIVIALFAVISGADSWVGIEAYGGETEEWLKHRNVESLNKTLHIGAQGSLTAVN
jgi:hypothetical protein